MTPTELFAATRRWLNDSTASTYKWTTAELVDYYNYIMDEIARETDYFTDGYTAGILSLNMTAGVHDYALASRVTQVTDPTLSVWIDRVASQAGAASMVTATRTRPVGSMTMASPTPAPTGKSIVSARSNPS